ncbi:hypothetical protein BH23BAC4_BH23BAC4_14860 [soil metagenome]
MLRIATPFFILALLAGCDSNSLIGEETHVPDPDPEVPGSFHSFEIDPTAAYLRVSGESPPNAEPIALASIGAAAGDTLYFEVRGEAILGRGEGWVASTADLSSAVLGAFTTSNALRDQGERYRLVGAIAAGEPFETVNTVVGDLPTNIAEDFHTDGKWVIVPARAEYLWLAVPDGYYSDNEPVGDGLFLDVWVVKPN